MPRLGPLRHASTEEFLRYAPDQNRRRMTVTERATSSLAMAWLRQLMSCSLAEQHRWETSKIPHTRLLHPRPNSVRVGFNDGLIAPGPVARIPSAESSRSGANATSPDSSDLNGVCTCPSFTLDFGHLRPWHQCR